MYSSISENNSVMKLSVAEIIRIHLKSLIHEIPFQDVAKEIAAFSQCYGGPRGDLEIANVNTTRLFRNNLPFHYYRV